ncbi:transporter associated domain-containing protein [Neobacillus cucumis]|uniref:transporter associated domain-containing protein n=1 Tax=Neobacillus cucumis TaxID=1740721 RepID=UPI0035A26D28
MNTAVYEILRIALRTEGIETLDGWFLTERSERITNALVIAEGFEFRVSESDGYHIKYVEIRKA